MLVSDIIEKVRWCIDKESQNEALIADKDDVLLDNMIKSHIGDALFWCGLYGTAQLLNGADTSEGIVVSEKLQLERTASCGYVNLPGDCIKLLRVRCDNWRRAVSYRTLISEDSDEYAELTDEIAQATPERPKACIIETCPKRLEVYPSAHEVYITYTKRVEAKEYKVTSDVNVPKTMELGFVYYIAFLTLAGMDDNNAKTMLEIAKMNIGVNE